MGHLVACCAAVLLVISVSACGSSGKDRLATEVLAADVCPASRCVSTQAATEALDWTFYEPSDLPAGFSLYARRLTQDDPGPGEYDKPESTILLDYRFQDSQNVPGIFIVESRPRNGPLSLRPQSDDCGDMTQSSIGPIYYSEGLIRVLPTGDASIYLVCMDPAEGHELTHSVTMAINDVMIEIIGFPESGVTRDEMLALVNSLVPVQSPGD